MWRSWRLQALSGSAQPLFGDKLTAAFVPPPVSTVDPIMTVADTTLYQQGDRIDLEPGTIRLETVLVVNIIDATHMQVNGQGAILHAHAVNSVICLANSVADIQVQANPGDTHAVYLGSDDTVTNTGGGNVIAAVTTSFPPWRLAQDSLWNKVRTNELWMAGTSPDEVIVAALVI